MGIGISWLYTKIMTKIKTKQKSKNNPSAFKDELLDEILKNYNHQNPEELIGSNGLLTWYDTSSTTQINPLSRAGFLQI